MLISPEYDGFWLGDSNLAATISPAHYLALLPETQALLRQWSQRQAHSASGQARVSLSPEPRFPYQSLPPSAHFTYELVQWTRIPTYLALFAHDPSPFIDARFKHRATLESYAVELLTDLRYSWKRGGCDWLLRRRADAEPLGVLHLYDLSHEVTGRHIPHCVVGYALAAPFRRQGFGSEALAHLLAQAAALFERTEVRALSEATNLASQGLLRKAGFALLDEQPTGYSSCATQLWQRFLP